ncbi:MAG: hypothetical protein VSS75_015715 [Candidatus Parabeggiatoa sp.]|nr:hypothetical protein [Candidatus Parabeggiatoa sp.]
MIKQYFWHAILLGILLLTIVHCYQKCHHFEEISSIQSPLIHPFKSYMDIEEARQMLPKHLRSWYVFEDYSYSTIQSYPPFNIYSVVVDDYKHLNYTGQLGLTFYNKRLATSSFFPVHLKSYVKTLEETEGLKMPLAQIYSPNMLLEQISSYKTSFDKINVKPYTYLQLFGDVVIWEDIRLLKEEKRWESCYLDD